MTRQEKSEKHRKWRLNNPGYHLAQYKKNRSKILRKNAEWSARNRQARLAYWKKRNSDPKIRARYKPEVKMCDLSPKDAAIRREKNRNKARKNSEKLKAYWKQYRADHPEKTKAHNKANWHRRRANIAKATVNLKSIKMWIGLVLSKPFAKCYYCDKTVSTKRIHFDHMVPLCDGGAHSIENLCVSCRHCNQEKHYKRIEDWIRLGQQVLNL